LPQRLRQENCEFEENMGNITRFCLKKKKEKKEKKTIYSELDGCEISTLCYCWHRLGGILLNFLFLFNFCSFCAKGKTINSCIS
jgi:hypothetical protein